MTEEIKAGQIIEYDKDNVPHFIIDGVDVSDCGFLDYHRPTKLLLCEECNSDFAAMECKDDPNCYYKQLKRLETENAKLKESNESLLRQFSGRTLVRGTEALFDITTAEFNYQIQRLKEENKKLKELLETRCYNEVEFENKKLKEKLEKIKEYTLSRMTGLACRHILSIIGGAEDDRN